MLEVHAIGLLLGFLYLDLEWLVMKNEFAFFFIFSNWQFSKSTNVYKSSSFVKLFCGLKKKKFMYFVLLGTKAQYIPFGPFEETRFDTGICTDNLIAMQASLLIFNIVLSYKPSFCHWYQYTNATNHLKRFLKI